MIPRNNARSARVRSAVRSKSRRNEETPDRLEYDDLDESPVPRNRARSRFTFLYNRVFDGST